MGWFWKKDRTRRNGHGETGAGSALADPGDGASAIALLSDPAFHRDVERALADLKSAATILEQQFGSTVTTLYSLSDRGRALVASSERLVEIASGKHSGIQVLLEGMALVEEPLRFLTEYRNRFDAERVIERLTEDRALIAESLRAETEIDRAMEPLRTVRTLFKVVAAPLGEHVHAIFESLVEELGELHTQSRKLVGSKFEDMLRVRALLDAMVEGMRSQQRYWAELAGQRAEMQKSLGGLESQLVANASRDTRIGSTSKRISSSIDQVVTGLQWQDIINQKLEHTAKAVSTLLGRIRDRNASPSVVNKAARLELAQLRTARDELAKAEDSIKDGLGKVLEELKQSDTSVVLLSEFQLLTTSSTGVVQLLLDSIESIESQLESALTSAGESMNTIREIGAAATALTSAVRELSERTLLVGLNAQVQACKVAQGAGLGVLSARTSDVSWQVSKIGDAVAAKLDRITGDLAACTEIFCGLTAQAEEKCGTFRASRVSVEQSLHGLRNEAFQLVQGTGGYIEEIDRASAEAISGTHYVETAEDAFRSLEELLERLVAATDGVADGPGDHDSAFDETFRSYTMASEREIFASLAAGGAATAAAATSASNDGGIELFGDEPSSDDRQRPPKPPDAGSDADSNIELF
jgi:hypothetical protein